MGRQADNPVGVAPLEERGDLGVGTAGRHGSSLDDREHAERALENTPSIDDADKKIAGEQRDGAPLRADPLPDLRREDLEAGRHDALGSETVVISDGANRSPESHGGRIQRRARFRSRPNRRAERAPFSLTAAVLILPGIAGGRQGHVHPRPASGRNAVLVRQQGFGRRSAYGLRSDYLAQMTCSAEEFAIPCRA